MPELWIYQTGKLTIYWFQQDKYAESQNSFSFPDVAIAQLVPKFIQRAKTVGITQALAEFEQVILEGDR